MPKRPQIEEPKGFDPSDFQDEWAAIQAATIVRDREQQSLDAQVRFREIEARDARRRWVWEGVAIFSGIALVAALIFGLVFLWYKTDQRNDNKTVTIERERTKQVEACTTLQEPIERQLCVMSLNLPSDATSR